MQIVEGLATSLPSGSGGGGGSGITAEQARDTIAAFIVVDTPLGAVHNDSANTFTISIANAGSNFGVMKSGGDLSITDGTGTISAGAITTDKISGLTATSSGFIQADGDGTVSTGTINVPTKASFQEVALGTNADKFITPETLAKERRSVDDGTTWAGFVYTENTPVAGEFTRSRTNATGWEFTFESTVANVDAMDEIIGKNSNVEIRRDETNNVVGVVDFAWRAANDTMGFRLKPNATATGSITSGSVSLIAEGALFSALRSQNFLTYASLIEGTGIEKSISADGNVTITATGGGNTDFANETEAKGLTITNKALSPGTFTAALGAEFTSLILDGNDALTYTTTTESQLPVGTFRITADHVVTVRPKNAASSTKLDNKLRKGKDVTFLKNASEATAEITTAITKTDISGSDIDQFSFTVAAHTATGTDFVNNSSGFRMEVLSPIISAVFDDVPHGVIDAASMSPEGGAVGQVVTKVNAYAMGFATPFVPRKWKKNEVGNQNIFGTATDTAWKATPRSASNGADSQAEITVTPQRTNSKFEILYECGTGWLGNTSQDKKANFRLAKSTDGGSTFSGVTGQTKTNVIHGTGTDNQYISMTFFDEPNTTDEIVYRVEWQKKADNDVQFGLESQTVIVKESL